MLRDERGFITEGTGNNFFMVRAGEILTPKPHDILRGVSRAFCMGLAHKHGIPVREADEAWYTSTTVCMVPITRFDLRPLGDGVPGPIYQKLLAAWSEEVGVDIAGQAREYGVIADTWTP